MNISPTTDVEAGDLSSEDVHNPRLLRPSVPISAPAEGRSFVDPVDKTDTTTTSLRLGRAMLSEVEVGRGVSRQVPANVGHRIDADQQSYMETSQQFDDMDFTENRLLADEEKRLSANGMSTVSNLARDNAQLCPTTLHTLLLLSMMLLVVLQHVCQLWQTQTN